MTTDLTEEEMRRALSGGAETPAPVHVEIPQVMDEIPDVVILPRAPVAKKRKVKKAFTPRLRVTLRVGNEFEGPRHEYAPGGAGSSEGGQEKIQVRRGGVGEADVRH